MGNIDTAEVTTVVGQITAGDEPVYSRDRTYHNNNLLFKINKTKELIFDFGKGKWESRASFH